RLTDYGDCAKESGGRQYADRVEFAGVTLYNNQVLFFTSPQDIQTQFAFDLDPGTAEQVTHLDIEFAPLLANDERELEASSTDVESAKNAKQQEEPTPENAMKSLKAGCLSMQNAVNGASLFLLLGLWRLRRRRSRGCRIL